MARFMSAPVKHLRQVRRSNIPEISLSLKRYHKILRLLAKNPRFISKMPIGKWLLVNGLLRDWSNAQPDGYKHLPEFLGFLGKYGVFISDYRQGESDGMSAYQASSCLPQSFSFDMCRIFRSVILKSSARTGLMIVSWILGQR